MYRYYLILFFCTTMVACQFGTVQSDAADNNLDGANDAIRSGGETILEGEHIQGPARLRDKVNGRLVVILNDMVPVSTTMPGKGWQQVGLFTDITAAEYTCACIRKGTAIMVAGKEVGTAVEDLEIEVSKSKEGLQGTVTGYTPISNIRRNTIPENILEDIISRSPNPSMAEMRPFLKRLRFQSFHSLLPGLQAYEIQETWIDSPSSLPRIWLLFENDQLMAVIHSRPLKVLGTKPVKIQHGLSLSMITDKDHAYVQTLLKSVTEFFQHAG